MLIHNDFSSLMEVEDRIFSFQDRHQEDCRAEPFEWKFTQVDLGWLCTKLKCNLEACNRELVAACCKIRHLNYFFRVPSIEIPYLSMLLISDNSSLVN